VTYNTRLVDIHHRLKIESFAVVSRIARGMITHICLTPTYDENGDPVIIVYKPGDKDCDLSQRMWRSVVIDHGKAVIRTPIELLPHMGQRLVICMESSAESQENELCRLRPLFDMEIAGAKKPKKRRRPMDPYFTNNGSLILPFTYFAQWVDDNPKNVVVSVDQMTAKVLNDHIMYLKLTHVSSIQNTSHYVLYKTTNGYRTRPMVRYRQFVESNKKKITDFIHRKTFKALWADFGVMIFLEQGNDYEPVQ